MSEITLDSLLSPKEFNEKHPKYLVTRIRWWIYRSKPRKGARGELPPNGFAECYTRDGARILLIEPKVLEWLLRGGDNEVRGSGSNDQAKMPTAVPTERNQTHGRRGRS